MRKPPITIATDRDAIRSSAEFLAFVEGQQTEARRRQDDAKSQIDAKRVEINRSLADHTSFATKIEADIAELEEQIADDDEILAAADRALTLRPAPSLAPHSEVADALGQQGEQQ